MRFLSFLLPFVSEIGENHEMAGFINIFPLDRIKLKEFFFLYNWIKCYSFISSWGF